MTGSSPGTGVLFAAPRARAVMDWLLANPGCSNADCGRALGLSRSWVSVVVNSPVFQREYQARQHIIQERLDESIERVAKMALDRLADEVETTRDPYFLLAVADKMCGHYIKMHKPSVTTTVVQQNNFVASAEAIMQACDTQLRRGS